MFKKIRFFLKFVKALFLKHLKIILLAGLIGGLLFFFLPRLIIYVPKPKRTKRIGLVGKYTVNQLPREVLSLLSVGLTRIGEDGLPIPALAKEWKVSNEGKTYTFVLQDNIFWQDETKVKAEDIKYEFQDVEQTIIDDKTIKFELKEAFSPFPLALSTPVFKENFIGFGPFKVKKIIKKGNFVQKIILIGSKENITFYFYPTFETAEIGFRLGEINVLEDVLRNPFSDKWQPYLDTQPKIKKDGYLALFFNTEDPFLSDKTVRQALSYTIPNKPKDERRALGPVHPDSWAYNSAVKQYEFDPKHAKELLTKSDSEGDQNSEELKIKISTTEIFLDWAELIKQSWEKNLSIKTEVEIVNELPIDYQVFLGMQKISLDPDQYAFWHSTRTENITNFKNPRIDKLLEDARRIEDIEERKEKYFDFQKSLLEEAPAAFILYPEVYDISRKSFFTW